MSPAGTDQLLELAVQVHAAAALLAKSMTLLETHSCSQDHHAYKLLEVPPAL